MPPATVSASVPNSKSLQWAILLLGIYAAFYAVTFASLGIPWEPTMEMALFAALLLVPTVLVPLLLAAALRKRAQWAWYATLLFAGWYALRAVLALAFSMSSEGVPPDLIAQKIPPTIASVGLCLSIVAMLARADARAACSVRAG